jgi:hypothetical protein
LFLEPDSIIDTSRTITSPNLIELARLWGLGLGFAAAAALVWVAFHFRHAWTGSRGTLVGTAVWFVLCLLPLILARLNIQLPNTLAAYRYVLAASFPLAVGVTIVAGMALRESAVGKMGVAACALTVAMDIFLRPGFQIGEGVIGLGLVAMVWLVLTRWRKPAAQTVMVVGFLALAAAVRLIIWFPSPPPEAVWLKKHVNSNTHVVTNWPLTNTLDALVPQPVIDGLAGADANLGLHRADITTAIRDQLDWCGETIESNADSLRAALDEMDALPAYLVVGESFEEAWRVYAEQHAARVSAGGSEPSVFFSAEPCASASAERLRAIRKALDGHPAITREFQSDTITIYEIQ